MTACSDKGETSAVQLSPKETVEKIFTLAKSKDYDSLAEYCRTFSKMSMELYFTDTGTDYDAKWLSRYSAALASIFDNYVTYDNLTRKRLTRKPEQAVSQVPLPLLIWRSSTKRPIQR